MKICATVAEYNPLHNGHEYHIKQFKTSDFDFTVAILSGNFTQRGEIAIMDKFTRSVHAVKSGIDLVIELPTIFATANAENFAKGAIKLFNYLNCSTLSFGCENPETDFITLAQRVKEEPESFKNALNNCLKSGYTFVKAKNLALKQAGIDCDVLDKSNNILALEYVSALLNGKKDFSLLPVKRLGEEYLSSKQASNYSSAKAIRENLTDKEFLNKNVPSFVFGDLPEKLPQFDDIILYSLLSNSKSVLASIPDCSEGLENRLKAYAKTSFTYDELLKNVSTKRYTQARLKRILVCSLLGINKTLLKNALKDDLYIKVLAINKEKLNILSYLSNLPYPVLTRKGDEKLLTGTAKKCFELDEKACEIYSLITKKRINPFEMKIV